jgi:hypothetical protein
MNGIEIYLLLINLSPYKFIEVLGNTPTPLIKVRIIFMARVNAQQYAELWSQRLTAAQPRIRQGIEQTSESPAAKAVQAEAKFRQNLNQAIDDGRWRDSLGKVTLQDWKSATIDKGLPRLAGGVQQVVNSGAQAKMAQRLLQAVDASVSSISDMPSTTLDDNINRMTSFVRAMSQYKGQISGK